MSTDQWEAHAAWAANCSLPMSSQPSSDLFNSEDTFEILPPLMPIPSTYQPGLGLMLACAAGLAWALYDHLITFPAEVRLVWQRRICIGSGLFGIVRYFGLLCLLNLLSTARQGVQTGTSSSGPPRAYGFSIHCHGIDIALQGEPDIDTIFLAPLWFIVFWTIDIMLQMRIYALYRNNRLAIFNGAMFILGMAAMLAFTYAVDPATCGKGTLAPGQICPGGIDVPRKRVPAFWVPALAFELWLAALALHKLARSVLRKNLPSTMVHDSIKYFALIAIGISAHLALSFYNVGDYAIPFVMASQTIGGSRLILHLREAYYDRLDPTKDVHTATLAFRLEAEQRRGHPLARSIVDVSFYVSDEIEMNSDTGGSTTRV